MVVEEEVVVVIRVEVVAGSVEVVETNVVVEVEVGATAVVVVDKTVVAVVGGAVVEVDTQTGFVQVP